MGQIYVVLTAIAAISPLLTFSALFQQKDWRLDRNLDHLRSEGALKQLLGKVRPVILISTALLALWIGESWPIFPLLLLAALAVVQILSRRQRSPKWTSKAKLVVLISLGLTLITALFLQHYYLHYLPLLPLSLPLIVALSLLLLSPLDRILKSRVHRKAMRLRKQREDLLVIGITGSVGKTTVKELLHTLLREEGAIATPAYVNSDMGVAAWLTKVLTKTPSEWLNRDGPIAIVEMGAYRTGEIDLLCRIAKPMFGVLTSIGLQHVGLFGSPEKLKYAKSELITSLPKDGHAFINTSNPACQEVAALSPCPVTGMTEDQVSLTPEGLSVTIEGVEIQTRLQGMHNATNLLLCIAVARHLGLSLETIADRIRAFSPPEKTFNVEKYGEITLLNDTHNASPASFAAVLKWAESQSLRPVALVTDGILELGSHTDRVHAELGSQAVDLIDRVIFLTSTRASSFKKGYKREVEIFSKSTQPLDPGTLLLCIGRVPKSIISRLTLHS